MVIFRLLCTDETEIYHKTCQGSRRSNYFGINCSRFALIWLNCRESMAKCEQQQPRRLSQQQTHHVGMFMTQRYCALLLGKAIRACCRGEAAIVGICPITVER